MSIDDCNINLLEAAPGTPKKPKAFLETADGQTQTDILPETIEASRLPATKAIAADLLSETIQTNQQPVTSADEAKKTTASTKATQTQVELAYTMLVDMLQDMQPTASMPEQLRHILTVDSKYKKAKQLISRYEQALSAKVMTVKQ